MLRQWRSGLRSQSWIRTLRRMCLRHRLILATMIYACFVIAFFTHRGQDDDAQIIQEPKPIEPEEMNWTEQPWNSVGFNPFGRQYITNISFLQMYNAVEDVKLQQYIASTEHNIKGVILFLAHAPRVQRLIYALSRLHKNFNQKFRYPIVIFHEADFLPFTESVRHAAYIDEKSSRTSPIFFQQVDLSVPDWITERFGQLPKKSCDKRSIGYRSMCRFQAKLMYEQKVMRHFDYYWRLDDDSKITAAISFDVFQDLVNGEFSYGFALSSIDDCAHNVYGVTEDYMKMRNIKPMFFDKLKKNEIILNNFEVSSMKFWLSKQYRDYIKYIDNLGGIYLHRWGDAPIKTLALSMHVPLRELHRFTNISYAHHGNPKLWTKFLV